MHVLVPSNTYAHYIGKVWLDLRFFAMNKQELQRGCAWWESANWRDINKRSVAFIPSFLLIFCVAKYIHTEHCASIRTDVWPVHNMDVKFNIKDKLKLWILSQQRHLGASMGWGVGRLPKRQFISDACDDLLFRSDSEHGPFGRRRICLPFDLNRIRAMYECGALCSMWIVRFIEPGKSSIRKEALQAWAVYRKAHGRKVKVDGEMAS